MGFLWERVEWITNEMKSFVALAECTRETDSKAIKAMRAAS